MTNPALKIIFMGTPEFSVLVLKKLITNGYKPVAVFCALDKPVGRKQILTPPPAKIIAQKYNLPVFQPGNSRELTEILKSMPYDLIITAAYGLILPKEVLNMSPCGCLNIHPSLLPKYRGSSPIQAAILNGDQETGVTIYKMDEQIDHGPIIATGEWRMANGKITTPELSKELAPLGADLLIKILPDWLAGKIAPQLQDDSQATFTKIIKKEDGQIDWQKSAKKIERQVRAYTPWPGTYTTLSNSSPSEVKGRVEKSKIKIIEAAIFEKNTDKQIGELFLTDTDDLAVQTSEGALLIKKLQLEGGEPLDASDFLRGHKDVIGQILA